MPSVSFKILPLNYLRDWGEFESWAAGVASAPDGWIANSTPQIARESSAIKFGSYAARVIGTNNAGSLGGIFRTIPNGDTYSGKTFRLGVWGRSASTGPYIEINDGVNSKTVHLDGSNAYVFTTTPSMKIDTASFQLRINLYATTNATAYFDGAVLVEGEDLFTTLDTNIDVSDWQPALSMKQDQYEISQREGSFIPDSHMQGRTIKLKGNLVGSDALSTRNNLDNFIESLQSWRSTDKRHLYMYDDRITDVFLKSLDWNYVNMQFIKYNLQFSADDPTTRYINKFRSRTVTTGTALEFNFVYNGNAESLPVISFIANQSVVISTCTLQNLTTAETLSYVGTVPLTAGLDIDCNLGTVFNSSVDKIADFSGDFLKIVRGTNYFKYTGSVCQINIDYFERYL